MGNLVESLLAGLGLMSGLLTFLMVLKTEEQSGQDRERLSEGQTRTIHPHGSRVAA